MYYAEKKEKRKSFVVSESIMKEEHDRCPITKCTKAMQMFIDSYFLKHANQTNPNLDKENTCAHLFSPI